MSKRERDYDRDYRYDSNSNHSNDSGSERRRKRKSRWGGDEQEKIFIPGMPTIIPSNLTKQQEEIYLLQLQIEALTRRLLAGDFGIPENPEERSPSPEPIYNSEGKRLNTREYRAKKKFEDERHGLIQKMLSINSTYKPPADYKPPQTKISEKVLIPQEEYPDINFVGLIIGPRGNTLKGMERDSGAKIIIRGKGSVKEGKLARKDGQPLPGEDEPLHAFVTGPTAESVAQAVAKINEVIRKGIELPENQNDLRRSQLRELALLNGTLRENDGPRCTNCGSNSHRSWQCPDKPNVTNNVFCTNCNGVGHIARDCKEKRNDNGNVNNAKIDEEYLSLMAELGEAPPLPPPSNKPPPPQQQPYSGNSSKSSYMDSNAHSSNSNVHSAQAVDPQQQHHEHAAAWNNGADMSAAGGAAATAASVDAWSSYMSASGYDPYSAAAYAHMWGSWGTAAAVPPPPPGGSGKDSTSAQVAATAYSAYDQAAQWSQYAQWYAAAQAAAANGTGHAATTAATSSASSAGIPPPPPPPPPSHYAPPPPPPPPPSH